MKWCAAFTWAVMLLFRCVPTATADEPVPDFERSIRPLLTAHCSNCHNASDRKGGLDLTRREPLLAGGDSGPALVAGNAADSLLWQRVRDGEMPPEDPLGDADQKLLHDWIAGGAPWSGKPLDPFAFTTKSRAGLDWWSLRPLPDAVLPPPPVEPVAVEPSDRETNARGSIDLFLEKKLAGAGLSFSPPADRRTLIRRLSFDLLGLPPSPDDIESFLLDTSPDAYERLVDRLLASPAYGERWARHWLDIIRFGESQGFERDKLRTNSWQYRDWVIRSWNEDLPYDEFARLQLAGDALRPDDAAATIATGFLVAGPYDEVGQKQQSAAMRAVVREDELEDIVGAVAQTFLGLTVNCARCHDHKFDPVRQSEYYSLTAALAGVQHGDTEVAAEAAAIEPHAITLAARRRKLEQQIAAIESPARERLLAERETKRARQSPPIPVARWEFDKDARDSLGNLHGELKEGARVEAGQLVLDGKGYVATVPFTAPMREKTLEAWVQLDGLEQQGGGVVAVQTLDGSRFDAIVFGEQEPRRWLAGSNFFERTKGFSGPEESEAAGRFVHVAIVYQADGTIIGYRDGVRYGEAYQASSLAAFDPGQTQLLFGLRHSPPGGNRRLKGKIDRVQFYDRACSDEEMAASAGANHVSISEEELVAALGADDRRQREEMRFELDQLKLQQARLAEKKVYAVVSRPPGERFVLIRGNPGQPADPVLPAGIAALSGVTADFELPANSGDQERRRKLAAWIADAHNPLFARVFVNRLWQYHFGTGLVDTPNDFGFNGGRPSHPELLDFLAIELIESGWSMKHMQRLIVTSAAYRQGSSIRESEMRVDGDNRLLWRKTPQRLEAETLRDTMLAVAGELNETMYGPGYYDFRTFTHNSQFYELRDPVGSTFQRRSLYRTWVRSGRSPLLDVFDCPDPSTKTPTRAVTTTPLQALSLLNNSFVLRTADTFAARLVREAGDKIPAQVARAFQLVYGREPDAEEQKFCTALVRSHGLAPLCRVLLNSSEFLYAD